MIELVHYADPMDETPICSGYLERDVVGDWSDEWDLVTCIDCNKIRMTRERSMSDGTESTLD